MTRLVLAAAAALSMTLPVAAAPKTVAVMDIPPDNFVTTVASSNALEIKSCELVLQMATDPPLMDLATRMIADHTRAADALKASAGTMFADLAPKHAAVVQLLQGAKGADFDMRYTDMQAGTHVEAVTLFAGVAQHGMLNDGASRLAGSR